MAECRAKFLAVEKFLNEMDDQRDRASLREAGPFDVLVSHVRSCGVWGGNAPQVAGAIGDFLDDLSDREVVPRNHRSRI